jgi:uncharacterized protein with PQ loop repeat
LSGRLEQWNKSHNLFCADNWNNQPSSLLLGSPEQMTEVISVFLVVFSLASKVSLADQIRINARLRSVSGLSIFFFVTAMLSYLTYVVYASLIHNWALILAQAPGAVLTLIVACQWCVWREKK